MRTTFIENIFRRHFGEQRGEQIVEAFVTSPQMEAVVADLDADQVAKRAELVKRLQEAPARHKAAIIAATAEAEQKKRDLEKARVALETAQSEHHAALNAAISLGLVYEYEVTRLQRELEKSADARIEMFATACYDVFLQLRNCHPKQIINLRGGRPAISYDNTHLVKAASALAAAGRDARDLRLQALTFQEVTDALEKLRSGLVSPLKATNEGRLAPPEIDGASAYMHLH